MPTIDEMLEVAQVGNTVLMEVLQTAAEEADVPNRVDHCNCAAIMTAALAGIEYGLSTDNPDGRPSEGKEYDDMQENTDMDQLRLKYPRATEAHLQKIRQSGLNGVIGGLAIAIVKDTNEIEMEVKPGSANRKRKGRSSSSNASKRQRSNSHASKRGRRSSKSSSSSKRRGH